MRYHSTDSDDVDEEGNAPNMLEAEQGAKPKVSDHGSSWNASPDNPNPMISSDIIDIPIEAECKYIKAYHL